MTDTYYAAAKAAWKHDFRHIWAALDHCTTSNYDEKALVPGYSVSEAGALPNQYHINRFTPEMMLEIRAFVLSHMVKELEYYFSSHIGVCNVRAWRYVHGDTFVGEHEDKIAPKCLKVMVFRGDVTEFDGPFEYLDRGTWKKITGRDPYVTIDTGAFRHRAFAPAPGHKRDCFELTIIPRITPDLPIINAGYMAGAPLDPMREWGK